MSFLLQGCVITDEGLKRTQNEDNFYFWGQCRENLSENKVTLEDKKKLPRAYFAVYDGMGGEEAGEMASLMAAKSLTPWPWEEVRKKGREQILETNRRLCEKAKELGIGHTGTTLVGLYLDGDKALCCNVGDSRGYLYRDGKLTQLSKDHSEGQQMVDSGYVTLEEAKKSRGWHQLTQHLGIPEEEFLIEPHYSDKLQLKKDDLFLLCSDGVTDLLSDEEIRDILKQKKEPKELAEELKSKVFERGAIDNTTIMLLRVVKKCLF